MAGPTTMMMAKTIDPMASPAQPGTARPSMTPKMTKASSAVPMNSAKVARAHGVLSPYVVMPRPRSEAVLPRVPTMASAPAVAPTTCATT